MLFEIIFPGKDLLRYKLQHDVTTIGRHEKNHLILKAKGVSRFHSTIRKVGTNYYITDCNSLNGTWVNDTKVQKEKQIFPGDQIRFDVIIGEIKTVNPTTDAYAVWTLLGQQGKQLNTEIQITKSILVGRDHSCEIIPKSAQVSRKHAELILHGESLCVKDLCSANGTYVNGVRVKESALSCGDTVSFGPASFEVGIERLAAEHEGIALKSAKAISYVEDCLATFKINGKEFELTQESLSIGRNNDNGIVLNDPSISGQHARLTKPTSLWNLEDLGSADGTLVNGQQIVKQDLTDGDEVTFGNFTALFSTKDKLSEAKVVIPSIVLVAED